MCVEGEDRNEELCQNIWIMNLTHFTNNNNNNKKIKHSSTFYKW